MVKVSCRSTGYRGTRSQLTAAQYHCDEPEKWATAFILQVRKQTWESKRICLTFMAKWKENPEFSLLFVEMVCFSNKNPFFPLPSSSPFLRPPSPDYFCSCTMKPLPVFVHAGPPFHKLRREGRRCMGTIESSGSWCAG